MSLSLCSLSLSLLHRPVVEKCITFQVLQVTALAEGYSDLEKNFTVQYNPSLEETLTMALSPETIVTTAISVHFY